MYRPITALISGLAGSGKSWVGASCPGPRLVCDAEKGSHFARRTREDGTTYVPHQLVWDPHYALPEDITDDTTVIVKVNSIDDVHLAHQWLASGQHPFRSVVIDSLTDLQLRSKQQFTREAELPSPDFGVWGKLLDDFIDLCQKFMDLTEHPTNPLVASVILAGADATKETGYKMMPLVQGALAKRLPYYPDLLGYLEEVQSPQDPTATVNRLHIRTGVGHIAKDRTHYLTEQHPHGYIDRPDIEQILAILNPEVTE
jgi:hypothetical protein